MKSQMAWSCLVMKLLILVINQKLRRAQGHHNFGVQLSKVEGLAGEGPLSTRLTRLVLHFLVWMVNQCIFIFTKLNYAIAIVWYNKLRWGLLLVVNRHVKNKVKQINNKLLEICILTWIFLQFWIFVYFRCLLS